ncbi:class I adenylate-forming enzyme family protein [Paenibacillus harenae]|uniref:class I adenylate-forming enzyme family protein n=1 Tax=Paenibacillus harenae TaxID=306543 RepID=UPI00278FF84B|nr:class I adenylate-forming enzyme family protein [Paenibacillus harenae]MDQ0062718.1 acyl-CoA synthetase (AMP-forming)/AMP-acid ligase II [Paenibacillus harenae]
MILSERLPLAASLYPEAPALLSHGQIINYGELHRLAEQLSHDLYDEGLRPGDRLALLGDPNPQLVLALYAAVGIGVIPLVLSPLLTVTEIAAILEDAEPHMLIHDNRYSDTANYTIQLLSNPPKLFRTKEGSSSTSLNSPLRKKLEPPPVGTCKRSADDTAVLIYTGGTTGIPKGVMHSHNGMAAWNQFTPSAGFGYDIGRRVLVLNISHLVGQFQLWATMAAGGCLAFLDEYPANRILESVERDQITHLSTVGQLLRDLTREASSTGRDMRSLKVIGCGGSVIAPETLLDAIAQFPGALIVNNYSQAECGMSISRSFPIQHQDDPIRLRSVGRPSDLADQGEKAFHVRIIAGDGREAAVNEPGEIVVRGAQTMIGYWRQPKASNEAMPDGWVRTGDVGYMDTDGYLYVLDRLKDMVIVGGSNVYCAEVEQVIANHEMVSDAAVIGLPLLCEGETLVACVILRDGGSLNLAQLQAFCEPSLARHKWPSHLFILDTLPRTAVDKVDKKQLRKQLSLCLSEELR